MKEYKQAFRKAFNLLEKYVDARSNDEFLSMAAELDVFRTALEIDLAQAVLSEVERVYYAGLTERRGA